MVVAPTRPNAETMSTRWPAQVKRTAVTATRLASPAAGFALVGSSEEGERGAQQDLQVDSRRAVLDVPHVELDPILPCQGGSPVDLRPAGEAGSHLESASLTI